MIKINKNVFCLYLTFKPNDHHITVIDAMFGPTVFAKIPQIKFENGKLIYQIVTNRLFLIE